MKQSFFALQMKKFILTIVFAFVTILFFSFLTPRSTFAFLGIGESTSEFDCQKFWEGLSDDEGWAIGGPRQGSISNISGWKFSSKKKTAGKTSGDACDIGGIRYDTDDSEGEAKTGFEINISYFPNQEEAKDQVSSLKSAETVQVEDQNISGDTYSMRTVKLDSVEGRPHFLASGNFGRTAGKLGNCVVTLTHTWYASAYQSSDVYEDQIALMDMVMGATQEGWRVLSETKDLQQFCGGKATGDLSAKPQQTGQSQSKQAEQLVKQDTIQDGNLFKIFGVNPFQTWLNLRGLAEVAAYIGTESIIEDAEYLVSLGVRARVRKEAEYKELVKEMKFIEESTARFSELNQQEKNKLEEVTKKFNQRFTATNQPILIQQGSATLQLQPLNGQPGVLESSGSMLESGALDVIVEPQNGQQFELQTPNTEILVIGTKFSVIYDPKKVQTLIAVYEGKVEVKTRDGQTTAVFPDGDKPGVVVVAQRLSVAKVAIAGVVLAVILGGAVLILKKKFSAKRLTKKKG